MLTDRRPPDRGETRQFVVACEGCSFERTADGREEAREIGDAHHHETTHEVVAVEVPPSFDAA